jgi:multimeric flavodoxin WrbA
VIKLVGISGSRVKNGNTIALLEESLRHARQQHEVETETVALAGMDIAACNHCNWCIRNQTEGQYCTQDDDMSAVYPKLLNADGIILATPVHFGRLSGIMADLIDRTRAFIHGNTYKFRLRNKIGGAMALAFFRGGGIETALSSLNLFFHAQQMIMANSGFYQLGAGAYSSPDGKGRFKKEPRHIVLEDEIGVMSAKLLADRILELAAIVKAGQAALQGSQAPGSAARGL